MLRYSAIGASVRWRLDRVLRRPISETTTMTRLDLRLTVLFRLAMLIMLALGASGAAQAATGCGGKGQRACCVLEQVPSCDKGLKEAGTCKKNCDCGKGLGQSAGMCVKDNDDDDATPCGAAGQRACCVLERIPSCNKGLVEREGCKGGKCACGRAAGSPLPVAGRSSGTCVKPSSCGGLDEKPCAIDVQISAGRKSCDEGLAEDFTENRCVKADAAFAEAKCRAVVASLKLGKIPDPMQPFVAEAQRRAKRVKEADLRAKATAYVQEFKPMVGELQRIHQELEQVRDLFDPDSLCSASRMTARLLELSAKLKPVVKVLLPAYTGHFHMAYTLNASAAAVAGFQTGYAVVTDYQGAVGVYVYLGPALVSNASLGDSIGVQFYPKATLDSFEGWGWGFGVAGGPPTKIFSGGVDVSFGDALTPQGLGISGAIGLGALPVDFSVAATHSWKLWSTP
jgi:hypothetical protein